MQAPLTSLTKRLRLDRPWVAFALWMLTSLGVAIAKLRPDRHNNFTIFRQSWYHLWDGVSLYKPYPEEYFDVYLYGPLFALLMAPISILPEPVSYMVWMLLLAGVLFYALAKIDLGLYERLFVGLFSAKELITGLMMMQYNVAVGAMIILVFVLLERDKVGWAALVLVLATLTKVYGIVALAFFPFCKHKLRFIGYCLLWGVVLACLPLVMGVDYVVGQYVEWLAALQAKGGANLFAERQNLSLLGMVRKISGSATYSDLWLILAGAALWGSTYLRFGQYSSRYYRMAQLSMTLLFCVLFSTGSETSSYIICIPGIALWYLTRPDRRWWDIALMVGTLIFSSFSSSDLFPSALKQGLILPYALKAFFPTLVWLRASYELLTVDYLAENRDRLCA